MRDLPAFQIDQHKAFQDVIVENKVNKEMPSVKGNSFFVLQQKKTRALIPVGIFADDQSKPVQGRIHSSGRSAED